MTTVVHNDVTAVILAGGMARRMGGTDKGLIELAGRPMVDWVFQAIAPQVNAVLINANRNAERYAQLGASVVADQREGYLGPLSGMASAMAHTTTTWLITAPCDSPFVPDDLVQRLMDCAGDAQIVTCHDGERLQPVFSLIRTDLMASLNAFLDSGERKIDRWFGQHTHRTCDFSHTPQTFININTPEERDIVEDQLRTRHGASRGND